MNATTIHHRFIGFGEFGYVYGQTAFAYPKIEE